MLLVSVSGTYPSLDNSVCAQSWIYLGLENKLIFDIAHSGAQGMSLPVAMFVGDFTVATVSPVVGSVVQLDLN